MSHSFSNQQLSETLKSVATALTIKKKNLFEIRAYQNAADSIEHSTTEVQDLWEEGKLDELPGLGKSMQQHLDELFKTGEVKHFQVIKKGIPEVVFELTNINGVGPKTAQELADLGIKDLKDLEKRIKDGSLVEKGFSVKIAEKILMGLQEDKGDKTRMLLPYAQVQADKILAYLKKGPGVIAADPLGSLRREVSTIGDLDFAVAAKDPKEVVAYFVRMPGVSRIIDQGDNKGTVMLNSGIHVDLLVGDPATYGALLQHFTGGKNHNIKLRTLALKKGLSLSEEGIKNVKTGKIIQTKTEDDFYKLLNMQTPPPEMREDTGEIEAALRKELPKLIELEDIKGDLHLHSNFPIDHPSHGPGVNPIHEIIEKAISLGYDYVGISDHPPAFRSQSEAHIIEWVEKRSKEISKLKGKYKNKIRVLNGLEIDILPDGTLSVPNEGLEILDYCIAGIHSGHRSSSENITKRILAALESPLVDIISHPSGRLLNERGSYDADWEQIFKYCGEHKKLLEINAFPNRLDLRDDLIREALKYGVKFVIDTDAHEVSQMENMRYGVAVARRGWVEAKNVVNTYQFKDFAKWFNLE
jgi:DNA polymerase (family X)